MRPGDPVTSNISALETVLKKMNFAYEWTPVQQDNDGSGQRWRYAFQGAGGYDRTGNNLTPTIPDVNSDTVGLTPRNLPVSDNNIMNDFNKNIGNNGVAEDLLDLTAADMGWDIDFSTMDLDGFFSIYPTMDTTVS